MSSETEGLPERDSSLKYMYFSFKEMQIYAAKVLQKNLIRSSTSARQVSRGSLRCMY